MQRKIEFTVDDSRWPLLTLTITRDSDQEGKAVIGPVRITFDLAYVKGEEMLHNSLRPVIEDTVRACKSKRANE